MEDLFPLLVFLVIVAINAIKFFAERGKTRKPAPRTGEAPPKRVSSIESFFENLAKQMEPKPTELPDWPEDRERPDYAHEMEAFEHPLPEEPVKKAAAVIIPMKAPPPPIARTKPRLRIKGKKNLKRAMLAHIVFSPPRALDPALKHNLAK